MPLFPIMTLLLQILTEGDCFLCGEQLTCTVRDVLYQPDYGGMAWTMRMYVKVFMKQVCDSAGEIQIKVQWILTNPNPINPSPP